MITEGKCEFYKEKEILVSLSYQLVRKVENPTVRGNQEWSSDG